MVNRARLVAGLLTILLVVVIAGPARARTYLFEVPQMTVDLWPQTNGDLRVRYKIVFKNLSADPLDIVDIGTPDANYRIDSFSMSINGAPLSTIRQSEYVTGVEIPLTPWTIKQNRTGALAVEFTHPRMVYYDANDEAFTSVEFGNTYFGSDFVHGAMVLAINWHFPDGVTGNETKWHGGEPTGMHTKGGHIIFTYKWSDASADQMYKTGIGFPARIMAEGAVRTHTWFDTCLEIFAAACGVAATCGPVAMIFLVIGGIIALRIYFHRKRMRKYLPPAIGIEGAGAKRGLTAPEAAVTLELVPDKVVMMILFGLIKKGAVRVMQHDPLKIEKSASKPEDLRPYEKKFLAAINKDHRLSQAKLKKMFVALIRAANKKLKGFSRVETCNHYRKIVDTAWTMVETDNTPEVGHVFAEQSQWLAMDIDFNGRVGRTFSQRPEVLFPHWWGSGWGHYQATPTTTSRGDFSLPGANWAADFTQSVSHFSDTVVDSVTSFTQSITQVTNPPPVSTSSGGGSGGGCACACACAGCACACAGGGR